MKSIDEFLSYLSDLDIKLSVDGESLRCNAPKGTLTLDIRTQLAERKAEIIAFLHKANFTSSTFELIRPIPRDTDLPLSFGQQRLWFIDQLEGANATYNEFFALNMKGSLQLTCLEQSLTEIVRRHEVLRTTFPVVNGYPVQAIAQPTTVTLPVIDLQDLPEFEQSVVVQRLATQEAQRPFNLTTGPLLRLTLLQLNEAEYVLLVNLHHIVTDGWSIGVLIQELGVLYRNAIADVSTTLPELGIQYADFAVWQRQWLQGLVLETQLAYWQKQLNGISVLNLPTDRPRPAVPTSKGAKKFLELPQSLSQQLEEFSHQQGVTLFMTMLAAFQTLLYRYTQQEDIVIGSPIANRNRSEIEGVIGFFVNSLVLRADLSGNPTFRELLSRVREVTLGAYAHQDLPFEKLVEELHPERELSRHPLFQVTLALQNTPPSVLELPGLTLSLFDLNIITAKLDLEFHLWQDWESLKGQVVYSTDLFDESTISRMLEHFQTLLESIVANPDQRLRDLPVLTAREQQQLLIDWNKTKKDYPHNKCFHQLFEAQVEQTPDAIALVFEDQQLTYRQLNIQANQLARHLQELGVVPEVLVGICLERSVEAIVGLLAILKAGGAYLPLDPSLPQERLSFMLEDAQVSILLTHSSLTKVGWQDIENEFSLVCLNQDKQTIAQHSQENPISCVTSDNLAYVIYTSGSTGKPKGVLIEHRGLCNLAQAQIQTFNLNQSNRILQFASLSFDASIFEIVMALQTGATLYLANKESLLPGQALIQLLQQQAITHVTLPPAVLAVLALAEIPTLQTIISAGEFCSHEIVKRWWLPSRRFFNAYGPTEATIWSTVVEINDPTSETSIGCPIANTQIYILDEHLQLVPIGIIGELYIGGDGLARGYLNRPELTAEKFIPNPFQRGRGQRAGEAGGKGEEDQSFNSERLYKTGDLARYLPNGNIEFLGRINDQVKIRGFRIELGEIEAVLSQYLAVQEAVVIVREDTPGDKRLVAYIVASQQLTTNELHSFLKEKLPDYMLPSAFVMLEFLPLTPNKKVDRRALPAPETHKSPEVGSLQPRTPTEEVLVNIWTDLLGIEADIHDDFFDIGGHSLLAIQLLSRVQSIFQVELPLPSLFDEPTIAALARNIESRHAQFPQLPPLVPRPDGCKLPLSFAQQRLWFLNQLDPESPLYNMHAAVRLTGSLNHIVLQQSLTEIVHRHEVLRTTIAAQNGKPILAIAPFLEFSLPIVNLSELPESKRLEQMQQLATQEAQQPFSLEQGPLLRSTLLQLSNTEHLLLMTIHHIVSDGWSIGILIQEVAALYDAFLQGQPSPLTKLPIQYADFALWQRQCLESEALATQLVYWQKQLSDLPMLELPTDFPRPAVQTFRGRTQTKMFSPVLSQSLKALSRQEGVTLFMTLLAGFQTLLHWYTSQDDIVVGTDVANRNRMQTESLIGLFVNQLVLRTNLSGNPTFRELLARVREVTLEAYAHQDLPFDKLVETLNPKRDLKRNPLFQVMFGFQNSPMPALELSGLTLNLLEIDNETSVFDLSLYMMETEQELVGLCRYNTDLFEQTTISKILRHLVTILDNAVAQPDIKVSTLKEILIEADKQEEITKQKEFKEVSRRKLKNVQPKLVT
ncbi:MAG: amino acid adenylation domain-containing protein [Nostoc sp.]